MPEEINNLPASSPKTKVTSQSIEVLILADSTSVANSIAAVLEPAKWQINWQQAANKLEYRDRLKAKLDLILWDAQASLELTEAIALIFAQDSDIPVIVVNGEASIPAAVAAIKAGAADYIPVTEMERLPNAIAKAITEPSWLCLHSICATQTEQQLQKLITENADGILVVNQQGIVELVNPAALKLLGKSSAELIGESLGLPVVNGDFLEVDIPLNSSEILVAQMRVSQIQWQGANAFVVSLRDITKLKQAEENIALLLEEAQSASRAKDEFLAVLSHELRTPLNPIVGWSQLLVKGNLAESQIKKGAEIIQRNAMLQAQLIGDILDISRIIQGKLKLKATPVDLAGIIHDALETISLAAQAKSIQINTDLDADLGMVQGDPTRLQQVIWNLLSNAVKFTPNGGRVEVRLTSVNTLVQENNLETKLAFPYAQIQIEDTGKGIAAEFLPQVFDYFRQAQSTKSRTEGGLGLGLAIVRRLVELHGGEVTASSPGLGSGATFTINLPIVNHQEQSAAENQECHGGNLDGVKILIVDDHDSSRDLLGLILEPEGAETKSVASATEALAVIEQFLPDILISDLGMPEIDGYELIQRIKKLPLMANINAIALSGYASEPDRQKSLTVGFDLHLNKPIDVDIFIQAVTQLAKPSLD